MVKLRHHHGELREALIRAGLELLENGGPDALTLRKCAARAGVSHAAPAHHFNGLISLKAAIVARGYKIFTQTMRDHKAKAGDNPRAQLVAICEGYLAFSLSHQALFRLVFQEADKKSTQINESILKEVLAESTAAYGELQDACAPFKALNNVDQGVEVMVWALVHGYAVLFSGKANAETPAGAVPDFAKILPDFPLK